MMNRVPKPVTHLPVKPDPERAAELQRRLDALQYRPEQGFHRDRIQPKLARR
jgi:hypothetical protein